MTSHARLIGLTLCLLWPGAACAPGGELKRTLHPPHERFRDRQSEGPPAKQALTQPVVRQARGLPAACKLENAQNLCIKCEAEAFISYRCYDYQGFKNPQDECQHTDESLRCLAKDPPFALYFSWRASDEKFLRENFLTWQDTVNQIWDGKLQGPDKEESERILKGLDWISLALSQRLSVTDVEPLAAILARSDEEVKKKGEALLLGLQKERLGGRLTLRLVLDRFRTFYNEAHGPSAIWEDVSSISLEGLED